MVSALVGHGKDPLGVVAALGDARQTEESIGAQQMEPRLGRDRLDLRLVSKQVAAMSERRLAVALAQPALDGLDLERRATRDRQHTRLGQGQQAVDGLQGRQIAVGLEVEVRERLQIGERRGNLSLHSYREPVLKMCNTSRIVARHAETPVTNLPPYDRARSFRASRASSSALRHGTPTS